MRCCTSSRLPRRVRRVPFRIDVPRGREAPDCDGARASTPGHAALQREGRRSRRIINTASMVAKQGGVPFLADYLASTFVVLGLTPAMAYEIAPHDIRVNCVCPGFAATPMQTRELAWEATLRASDEATLRQSWIDATPSLEWRRLTTSPGSWRSSRVTTPSSSRARRSRPTAAPSGTGSDFRNDSCVAPNATTQPHFHGYRDDRTSRQRTSGEE